MGMSSPDNNLLNIAQKKWPNRRRVYKKGKVLYWQGETVQSLFVIEHGAVKISSLSPEGKIYVHGILGAGHLLSVDDFFLDSIHSTTAEAMNETSLLVIPPKLFQTSLDRDQGFSALVMQELARETKIHSGKAQDLSFLDVQRRLRQALIKLAKEHGVPAEGGIEIGVDITHEDLGQLINANRTTITLCLQKLKKLGYIWTEGRRILLIPEQHMKILDQVRESLLRGKIGEATEYSQSALEEELGPLKILQALADGMKEVDRKYTNGAIELNDVMWSAIHMKEALPNIKKAIRQKGSKRKHLGTIVFGTVQGDIHDIGKTITSMLLLAHGFEVIDLGVNVSAERFKAAVHQHSPEILAMSALLTTTQPEMEHVIQVIEKAKLRDRIKIMIGGAPTTPKFADEIGADGYGLKAKDGVELAWAWCTSDINPTSPQNTRKLP